jgi:hypothetical protein
VCWKILDQYSKSILHSYWAGPANPSCLPITTNPCRFSAPSAAPLSRVPTRQNRPPQSCVGSFGGWLSHSPPKPMPAALLTCWPLPWRLTVATQTRPPPDQCPPQCFLPTLAQPRSTSPAMRMHHWPPPQCRPHACAPTPSQPNPFHAALPI